MALKYIYSRHSFLDHINESIKTAKEYFSRVKRASSLPQYKQQLIQSIGDGSFSLGPEDPEEQISKIESGEMDRELEKMMSQDAMVQIDDALNQLFEKIKLNKAFGPNVLALPITKMYLRYPKEEHLPNLLELVDFLDDVSLREFLKTRNIDLGRLLNEYAEKKEENGMVTYEMLTDYLTNITSEIRANWLIKLFKTDAAMGRERNLPPFNQVEAFRSLSVNDPIKLRIISCAEALDRNRDNPAVAAAIVTIKDKIAGKDSLKNLVEWLERTLDNALNSSAGMVEFLKAAVTVGGLIDIVYQDESKVVIVAYHEIALATLFPMAQWCILPPGWGGGRGMWSTYAGPSKNAIQFAVMDFSNPPSSNMRCWAFSYNVDLDRITHVHAKDDANILGYFNTTGLRDIFTEKGSIGNYPDSSTFTIPPADFRELEDSIAELYDKTVKYDSLPKIRGFSNLDMFAQGGVMKEFIGYSLRQANAKAQGKEIASFVKQNKAQLDMIISYLAADVYSSDYKNNIRDKKPTLADTFISPFLKPTGASKIPYVASGSELATYLIAVMKASGKFTEDKVISILKNLNLYLKLLNRDKTKAFARYQIEEAIDAIKVYLKALDINTVSTGGVDKGIKQLTIDDSELVAKFIEDIGK
jgi:hypothetical protein